MVDDTPLLSTERPLTRARWWVLLVYCLLAVCQAITWNVFSPIFPATFLAMPSWSSSFLSWVINTANISFGLTLVPVSLAVKRFGPRRITLCVDSRVTSSFSCEKSSVNVLLPEVIGAHEQSICSGYIEEKGDLTFRC